MKYLLASFLLLAIACKKDKSCEDCENEGEYVNAIVFNGGPVAADGCDWLIRIGNTHYHPKELSEQFKQNDLAVRVLYRSSPERFFCGLVPGSGIPVIEIVSIIKQ